MSELRLGMSPITGNVYVGRMSKDESHWVGDKTDVTEDYLRIEAQRLQSANAEIARLREALSDISTLRSWDSQGMLRLAREALAKGE